MSKSRSSGDYGDLFEKVTGETELVDEQDENEADSEREVDDGSPRTSTRALATTVSTRPSPNRIQPEGGRRRRPPGPHTSPAGAPPTESHLSARKRLSRNSGVLEATAAYRSGSSSELPVSRRPDDALGTHLRYLLVGASKWIRLRTGSGG